MPTLSARLALATAFLFCLATPAAAVPLTSFSCITNNIAGNCTIGETQLSATLVASGSDALLTITMSGGDNGVGEQIFIESNFVSAISFNGSVGVGIVAFGTGQSGGTLPGGTNVLFIEAVNISADNPAPRNGIGRHNQDDTSAQAGAFLLTLSGGDFAALLGDLRVGVHVISFDVEDGSESFVASIPEPGTLALLAVGLLGLGAQRRLR